MGEQRTWRLIAPDGRESTMTTTAEVTMVSQDERDRGSAARAVLADLDRCEHGRHEGDACSECGGPSIGNRFLGHGQRIGTLLHAGGTIVVPEGRDFYDPAAWLA